MNYEQAYNELLKRRQSLEVLNMKIEDTRGQITFEKKQLEQLFEAMEHEKYDVDQLSKVSLKKMISIMKGNLDGDYEKEHQEFVEAKLKYDEKQNYINGLEEMLNRYNKDAANERQQIYKEEANLIATYPEAKEKKDAMEDKKNELYRMQKEVEEALYAVGDTISCAQKAKDSYKNAKSWSTYDTFFNGGLLGDLMKYSNLDDAQELMNCLQSSSKIMVKECKDVDAQFRMTNLTIDSTVKFFDIAFDNIFTDWSVRENIKNAIVSLEDYCSTLNRIYEQLQAKERMILKELEQVKF